MSLSTAYLALGSNHGQRLEQMRSALNLLKEQDVSTVVTSPVYENRAIGMGNADPFLNAVVEVHTNLEPQALLAACLDVESKLGRVRSETCSPRTIDIDILVYGQVEVQAEQLHLPHPRITERDFVLQPLADIAPGFKLRGHSISEWLHRLPTVELSRVAERLFF